MKIVTDSSRKDRVMNVFQKIFFFDRGKRERKWREEKMEEREDEKERGEKKEERSGERIVYNLTSVRQILNPTYYMQMSHEKKNENERVKEKGRERVKEKGRKKKDKKRMNESICVPE